MLAVELDELLEPAPGLATVAHPYPQLDDVQLRGQRVAGGQTIPQARADR